MTLIPLSWSRALSPLLQPLRWLVQRRWLREAEVDAVLAWLQPGWRLNRVFARVEGREWVAEDMLTLRLRCNGNARGWRAGQHVQLYLQLDGVRHSRSYSLTRVGHGGRIELAIRRQPGGRLSNRLLDHLAIGSVLELGQAQGELHWPQDSAGVVLLAAGSGITPLLGLLREALSRGFAAPISLLHYVREQGQRPFVEELQQLMQRHPNLSVRWALTGEPAADEPLRGRFTGEHLQGLAPDHVLACGPAGFVETVARHWRGPLQVEAFTAPERSVEPGSAVRLGFARARRQVTGDSARSLLEQAEAAGLRPAHGCRQGICASCTCTLLGGTVRDLRSGALFAEPGQPIRLCISAPAGDVDIDL
ncbi:2Fe-2S iron-sulfur cluster binding domain-containing protein [Pseudomonas sp. L-22-4S-12]|uniref:ferredoxin reductase n=1 Tax=Pseudomonas sp. L-22-4S-12 TaxID=2610893 RepID=UPI001327A14B|nr:ferredoxin reductase [Pseudomonas sp. L-22-4S-12]MWV15510.1 2Fe-2S iron-sulfur cluster binding domain-containing protein [Pseudomonas sp. L-22-4S-12]